MRTRVRNRARRPAGDPAIEDQLNLLGTAEVEVLADHLLEEQAAVHRPVEHLGQRELGLQDRDVVAVAGLAIRAGERMRQQAQPFAQQAVDLLRPTGRRRSAAGAQGSAQLRMPLSSASNAMPSLRQLALGVFMAVDAQLGIVGKVGAELQEERAEVLVHRVEVIVVHHGGRSHDPRIGPAGGRAAALLGAEHRRLLLRLADEDDPFLLPNARRCSAITSSLRWPLRNCTRGISCCATKRSSAATKPRLIGLISAADGSGCPRCSPEEPHDPPFVLQHRDDRR